MPEGHFQSPISDVSDTALWVAVYRALETSRPDALFRDPFAGQLAGDRGTKIAAQMEGFRHVSWSVVIRTCIIDNYILQQIQQGTDTIINLGAGLDTRPYRLNLPSNLHWIEVDYPKVIDFKEDRLRPEKPRCHLERVSLNLTDHLARQKLFNNINARTTKALVITEGVVPYLSNEDVASIARDLLAQKNFKAWIVDYFSPNVLNFMRRKKFRKQMENAPLQFSPIDWFVFFEEHGWKVSDIRYLPEESEKLGRSVPLPWWLRIAGYFLSSQQKNFYQRSVGYALLKPK